LCICNPDIDVAAIPNPKDIKALTEWMNGGLMARWLWSRTSQSPGMFPDKDQSYRKVADIFWRSKKVDMCQYLLAKGYIKHADDPEVLLEAPPMFHEGTWQGSEEAAGPAAPDPGVFEMEDKDKVDGDLDKSDPEIKPLRKRMTDLSIYYDANEDWSEDVV